MLARLLSFLSFFAVGRGDVYTYPVKSTNLEQAFGVEFYAGHAAPASIAPVSDLHAVHGIETSDGGYVLVGKGVEREDGSVTEAFAVKLSASGSVSWTWKSGVSGDDAANAVIQLPSGGALIVAGWRTRDGVGRRCLTKLDLASGEELWDSPADEFGDSDGQHGAIEMLSVGSDYILMAGVKKKPTKNEMTFKSYGNVFEGTAFVARLPLTALTSSTAPGVSALAWTREFAGYNSAKAARISGSDVAVLLFGEDTTKHASVAMIKADDSSQTLWGPTDYAADQGEGTDIAVTADGTGIVIVGLGGDPGIYDARLSLLSAANGALQWTKSYNAGGTPEIIFHECFGVQALADGYVMSCGSGIEDTTCRTLSGDARQNCEEGRGDLRSGAYPRTAGIWQTFIVRTDLSGELQWSRVDSYKDPCGPDLGSEQWLSSGYGGSSAAEWVVSTSDGGLAVFTDEVFGFGLLKLKANAEFVPSPNNTESCGAITDRASGNAYLHVALWVHLLFFALMQFLHA